MKPLRRLPSYLWRIPRMLVYVMFIVVCGKATTGSRGAEIGPVHWLAVAFVAYGALAAAEKRIGNFLRGNRLQKPQPVQQMYRRAGKLAFLIAATVCALPLYSVLLASIPTTILQCITLVALLDAWLGFARAEKVGQFS